MMGAESDKNGNYHGDGGKFVSLRDFIERIFSEKERATEFARVTLERALVEARVTTERAMTEAKATTERALTEAKIAADERGAVTERRIESLESGGAPFASRLDESFTRLKTDVDNLKDNMVRTAVLDAVREQNTTELKAQKKQIRLVFIAASLNFILSLVVVLVQVLGH